MLDLGAYAWALAAIFAAAFATWLFSLWRDDVSIVDSLWSLMFLLLLGVYQWLSEAAGPRAWLALALVVVWALRLSIYITVRNHGQGEDRRYQAIRRRNQPGFRFKSLYLVFGLQAALAGFIALPLAVASSGATPLGWIDALALALWTLGMLFEGVGDAQLARFKADPANQNQVMDRGLWRYTRHPNYFGECVLWWGYFLLALAAGGWWTVLSPALMTLLLLKVSGVALLEADIGQRRPAYRDYIRRTNAFFPGPPKPASKEIES